MDSLNIYKRAKNDILQSRDVLELQVAKNYMDLAKFHVNFNQWNDLQMNYENKKQLLTENIYNGY